MEDIKNKILKAEETIIQLAEELEKAKTVTEQVSIIERKLSQAHEALQKSISALEQAEKKLETTGENTQITLTEARKIFIESANALENFRKKFENDIVTLSEQNNKLFEKITKISGKLNLYSSLIMVTVVGIIVIILLLLL